MSEHAGNGAVCFEAVLPAGELGAPPAGAAPVPAPEPEPDTPLVVTVTEEEAAPGEYKCLKKSQIREGSDMESAKAGVLDEGERIDILETLTLESGLVRCRFLDGWISAQTHAGDHTLERTLETSGETVKCGECTLSKEAYQICMKMNR